jgi:hypothetical protein
VADNVLDRQFQADGPNQKWVADFSYIWTAAGWLYVAAVLDLSSRRIVGWSTQESKTSQLVVGALMMAVWRRGKPVGLLHHSDKGSQYTSEHFQKLMEEHGITRSMSRAGEVWDNSAMESFFSSLKTERTSRKVYRTRGQSRSDVFDYIECFYNPTRGHSTLGYLSPVQFEQAQEAYVGVNVTGSSPHTTIGSVISANDVVLISTLVHVEEEDVIVVVCNQEAVAKCKKRQAFKANLHVAMRPRMHRTLYKGSPINAVLDKLGHTKDTIRAKVKHSFRVIKRQFGNVKAGYRGLPKDTMQFHALFTSECCFIYLCRYLGN